MQSRSEAATKFTYNPAKDSWQSESIRVVVENQPFEEGGMRYCMKLYELEDNGTFIPCVAKIFKSDSGQEAYFDEALAQMAAECFAQRFNHFPLRHKIAFLPVSVMMLEERNGLLCNVEPMMSGKYIKHNDNNGHVESKEALPQTFSHWTWEASEHTLVVCDIQGVGLCYTDPQVHSLDGYSFGQGNLGKTGILKFLRSHKCNALCASLGLPPMHRTVAERQVRHRLDYLQKLSSAATAVQFPNGSEPNMEDSAGYGRGAMAGSARVAAITGGGNRGILSPVGPKVPVSLRSVGHNSGRRNSHGEHSPVPDGGSRARAGTGIAALLQRSNSPTVNHSAQGWSSLSPVGSPGAKVGHAPNSGIASLLASSGSPAVSAQQRGRPGNGEWSSRVN
mmetsp:Transcript_460/g.950  ORF Transcript_460/g.950 Transcript_460/m.950 type:complete len:392 (+) Transcript_460:139-1314(+)